MDALLLDFDGLRYTLLCSLPDEVMIFFRNFVELDDGQQLVFIILKNFRAQLVAVPVSHAPAVDADFHSNLLSNVIAVYHLNPIIEPIIVDK
jgi:hypothetical protein